MAKIMTLRISCLLLTCWVLSQSALMAAEVTITVTKEQGGREITLKVGNILQIELPGRGGTGYLWSVENSCAPYLKLMDQATEKVGESRPGSPVMQVWRFKAEKPGAIEIKIAYYRPWEGVGKAVDHFRLKLHID
jgi:inhibitor of cysteine peptidase